MQQLTQAIQTPATEIIEAARMVSPSDDSPDVPGTVYHLISRFVGEEWFIDSDEMRGGYLALLGSALEESDWRCLAYAIMSNHIHLTMIAGQQPLAEWAGAVHSPFGAWVNRRRKRIGAVFARGPSRHLVFGWDTARVLAYLHNNPVRAGVVKRASDSDWTSHRAYSGLVAPPSWLHAGEGLRLAGFNDSQLFEHWVDANELVRWKLPRRSARCVEQSNEGAPAAANSNMSPKRRLRSTDPDTVVSVTAEILGIPRAVLVSRRRVPLVVHARRVAVAAGLELGMTLTDIAKALDVSVQAVHVMARRNQEPSVQAVTGAADVLAAIRERQVAA